jgi:hypothetical protein
LGAGTGALSPAIQARLSPGSRYVAVEVDGELVAHLHRRMPWLEVLPGDAADLATLLRDAGVGPVERGGLVTALDAPAARTAAQHARHDRGDARPRRRLHHDHGP